MSTQHSGRPAHTPNLNVIDRALASGSEQMDMPEYLAAQRLYVVAQTRRYIGLVLLGAPSAVIEDARLELASLGVRT